MSSFSVKLYETEKKIGKYDSYSGGKKRQYKLTLNGPRFGVWQTKTSKPLL